jgi:hypothetical protein
MFRKDYMVRQLEEFGKVMAVILGFKRDRDWEKFEKEIELAAKKFSGKEIGELEAMSAADFEALITSNNEMTEEQVKMLGELLFEKMLYYKETGNEKFDDLKNKCTFLYNYYLSNLTQNQLDLGAHYKYELLKKL